MCKHFFQHRWWIHGIAVHPSCYLDSQEPLHDSSSQAHCRPVNSLTRMTSVKVHYWWCTICYSPFVILVIITIPKVLAFQWVSRINPKWLTHPPETAKWPITRHSNGRGPEPSLTHKVVSVKICLHLYERERRRNLTLEKSVSVYKSLAYSERLSSMSF